MAKHHMFPVSDRTIGRAVDSRIGENLITMNAASYAVKNCERVAHSFFCSALY